MGEGDQTLTIFSMPQVKTYGRVGWNRSVLTMLRWPVRVRAGEPRSSGVMTKRGPVRTFVKPAQQCTKGRYHRQPLAQRSCAGQPKVRDDLLTNRRLVSVDPPICKFHNPPSILQLFQGRNIPDVGLEIVRARSILKFSIYCAHPERSVLENRTRRTKVPSGSIPRRQHKRR